MSVELRGYQIDVTNRARQRFAAGLKRGIIQAPTGAGKTVCSSYIVRLAAQKNSRVLFLAHRRRLVHQKSDMLKQFGVAHGVIMSDVRNEVPWAPVQVASKDTLVSRAVENQWIGFPEADLVIVDECRHSLSEEFQKLLKRYEDAFILGLDATPTTSDGRGLGPYYQFIESTVPTSQLVREGFLCPIRAYSPERAGAARRRGQKTKGLVGDPVSNWRRWGEDRPTVLFASKIAASQAACKAFNDAGIPAEHIDSHSSDEERDAVIERVRSGKTKVVTQCSLWTEGVDIPELSCCILLRMAKSCVLFYQAVGRIMRPHPSKSDGVLIDHAGAIQEHGFPDEDAEWTLDPEESVDSRVRAAKLAGKRKRVIVCPRCSYTYSGSVKCPACGHVLPKYLRPVETRDELLTEVQRGQAVVRDDEEKKRYWYVAMNIARKQNKALNQARFLWKKKFGYWPPDEPPFNKYSRDDWQTPVSELIGERRVTA